MEFRDGARERTDGFQVIPEVQMHHDLHLGQIPSLLFENFSLPHPFIDSTNQLSIPQIGDFSLKGEICIHTK